MKAERATPLRNGRRHVHVFSRFGPFCYLCLHRHHWWAFWERWADEEHDEPF